MFRSSEKLKPVLDLRAQALMVACALALGGCSFEAPRTASEGAAGADGASFQVVGAVKDGGTVDKAVNAAWQLPTEKQFKFEACLTSVANGQAIPSHRFAITDDRGMPIGAADSDNRGCVSWAEDVAFQPLAHQPTYLTFIRRLTADGRQRGTVSLKIGANPWSGVIGSEPAVVDLDQTPVHRLVDAEESRRILNGTSAASAEAPASRLLIPRISHEFVRAKSGAGLAPMLRLTFKPEILVKTMAGAEVSLPVNNGALLLKPRLLRSESGPKAASGKKTQLHDDLAAVREQIKDGQVTLELALPLNGIPRASGLYELALTASPDSAPLGLASADGVYNIGDHANLARGMAELTNESKADGFSTKSLAIEIAKKGEGSQATILAEPLHVAFARMEDNGGLEREIGIEFSTNLLYSHDLQRVEANHEIEISALRAGGKPIKVETLPGGRIQWEDTLTHQRYAKQRFEKFVIRITDKQSGEHTERTVILNLADTNGPTFGADAALRNISIAPPSSTAKPRFSPRFKLDTVCMARKAIDYQIDTDLNLVIWNRYQIRLQGEVTRPDSLSQGVQAAPEALASGRYLVSLLIYRAGDIKGEKSAPVIASQKIVSYEGGQFSTEVLLPINQLSLALLKNYLVVQVTPLADAYQANPPTLAELSSEPAGKIVATDLGVAFPAHVTAFTPPAKDDCVHIDSRENTLDRKSNELQDALQGNVAAHELARTTKLVLAGTKTKEEEENGWKKSAERLKLQPILLARDSNLRDLGLTGSLADVAKALDCWDKHSWTDEADQAKCLLDPAVKQTGAELCSLLKISNAAGHRDLVALNDCQKNGRDLLRVEERSFVYQLGDVNYKDGLAASFSISSSFGMGKARFTDYGNMVIDAATLAVGAGVAGSISSPGKAASASGSVTIDATAAKNFWSVESNSHREVDDNYYGFSSSVPMNLERKNFELELKRHRTCYAVGAKGLKHHNKNEKRIQKFQGALLCFAASDQARKVRESYYHIFTPDSSVVTIDGSVERNRIMIPVRGERDYYFLMRGLYLAAPPFYRNGVPIEIQEILKRSLNDVVQKLPAEAGVIGSHARGRENYEAIQEKIKKMDPFWNPWNDYGNIQIRNINDPELRRDVITDRE